MNTRIAQVSTRRRFEFVYAKTIDTYVKFLNRMKAVRARVEHDVTHGGERYEFVRTDDQFDKLVAAAQDGDQGCANLLAVYDRQNRAATASGVAVIIQQNDEIIRLLTKIAGEK